MNSSNTDLSRRQFLRTATGMGVAIAAGGATGLLSAPSAEPSARPTGRKLIVVLFGGGTRSLETMDDPEHRHIPRLWREMVPRGTLFTDMRVEHKVVHPNSAGSVVTGHWEWDDLDWTKPVAHPTLFEIYRKARRQPDTAAWAFVYASILAKTAESQASDYGTAYAANVIEPPTIPRSTAEEMSRLMQHAAWSGSREAELAGAARCAALARETSTIAQSGLRSDPARAFLDAQYERWKAGGATTSHDAFLTDCALACMREFSPEVMAVDYGEIDCAHYGSWSRYVEAIRRTDELTWRLWHATEELPSYRGQTLMLILPDHGRELDGPDRWGFIHHSDFYSDQEADEGCRRIWMLALGPGVAAGRQIKTGTPITTVAATGLEYLGLDASHGAQASVMHRMM